MRSNGNCDDLARASRAGTSSSGDGGGGGEAALPAPPGLPLAPPPTSPSRDPTALSTSPPPLQPPGAPPRPADQDTDEPEEEDDGDWDWEKEEAAYNFGNQEEGEPEDDTDSKELEEGKPENGADSNELKEGGVGDASEFFSILRMSRRRSIPDHILRSGFAPLNKHEYFSLRQFWKELLGGKRSYLRPPKGHRVVDGVFRCPNDPPRTLGLQEQLSELIHESSDNYIIQEKIKILSKQYGLFRRTRSDGSCFYRALLFSYLENLGQMQDRQAEVTRLKKHVGVFIKRFCKLEWEGAYFLNPKEYFVRVAYEFFCLVTSVAKGLTSDKLYERSLGEFSSGMIISFLRLLTEIQIRTQAIYKPFILIPLEFCWKEVRGLYAEDEAIQMRALTYALGIPLRVEIVDRKKSVGQPVRVKRLDFFRQSDLDKGPLQLVQSYYSSSTAHKPQERGSKDSLLASDGAPLLTLLRRRGHCDILYRT